MSIICDDLMSGSARVEDTRIRVLDVVEKYEALGYRPEQIAEEFNIDVSEVYDALSYYEKNREKIREEIRVHRGKKSVS